MKWQDFYLPPNPINWQGRTDTPANSAFFQIVCMHNFLKDGAIEKKSHTTSHKIQSTFALVGFCCDEGIRRNLGRVGSAKGPKALRDVLAKLPVHNLNFNFYDVGDIVCVDGNLEGAQFALGEIVAQLLIQNIIPIVIGGGHEVAWGHYQGIIKALPQKKLGIVNFDAHLDMRPLLPNMQGSSGTPFLQIAHDSETHNRHFDYNCIGVQPTGNTRQLFETARKYNVNSLLAEDLYLNSDGIYTFTSFVDHIIQQNAIIYTTICLDVFSVGFAPGVSAVQPLGVTPWQVIPFIRQLASSGKVVTYDIAELSPQYDTDQRTAKLAACLIYEIIRSNLSPSFPSTETAVNKLYGTD